MTTNHFDENAAVNPGDVSIMLMHSTSNQPPYRVVDLEITDRVSRQQIISVRLTPEQLGYLLGSTTVYASADLPRHPERIGKRMEVASEHLSYAAYSGSRSGQIDIEATAIGGQYRENGWDSVAVSSTASGRTVTARRWVEP